jgi:sulfur-oxidizing protein SoxY
MILKGGSAGGLLAVAAAAGLTLPARAAEASRAAFDARSLAGALGRLGAERPVESADIVINAPDIAENGAVIPIEVTCRIAGARSIALLAANNPFPLIAQADLSDGAQAYLSTRIKMGQSSVVKAVVWADGKQYVAGREIRVTIGGCGG